MASTQTAPLGIMGRVKSAGQVMLTGKLPNPLASEPSDKSRAALVRELNDWCVAERTFWKPVFDRIRQEQRFAAGKQWDYSVKDLTLEEEKYIGDMVQQMTNRKTAALYAKNPTPEATLKDRMYFTEWDGEQETIDNCHQLIAAIAPQAMQAHEAEMQGQQVPPPPDQMQADLDNAQRILADYQQGMQIKAMFERIGETGTKLIAQQWSAQSPELLVSAKQAVTRVINSRVAYIKVMYKRDMESLPTETANEMEFSDKIAALTSQLKAMEDADSMSQDDPKIEETRLMKAEIEQQIAELQQSAQVPTNEGIVIDWLSATSVIIDRRCKLLKEFVGAHRIAHEIMMTVEECEKKFKVSLRNAGAKFYTETGDGWKSDESGKHNDANDGSGTTVGKQKVCVWEIQDKDSGLVYSVCDGVKDFLREPGANEPSVNRFWSIIALTFNTQEIETNDPQEDVTIYPRSDVRLMMPMQINVNKAGNEKRLHRSANRPWWIGVKSKFSSTGGNNDLDKLSRPRDGHDVLLMENLAPGEKIEDFIQPGPKQPFDENLYDNSQDSQAMMLATGQQPSDIGAQRPDEKATGQNIAAQARAESEASNIDDLDFAFSTLAQMCWEMLIQEMPQATVQKLVGRGAVWPELNRQDAADAIFFKIEAGSMGRPNQQATMQKIQTLTPLIMDMLKAMGRSPEPFLKLIVKAWDANIDVDDLLQQAQVLPPPAPAQAQQTPPSVSISANLKDLPPTEQNQAVQKFYGLKAASPGETLVNKAGIGKSIDAHHQNANPQPPATKNLTSNPN